MRTDYWLNDPETHGWDECDQGGTKTYANEAVEAKRSCSAYSADWRSCSAYSEDEGRYWPIDERKKSKKEKEKKKKAIAISKSKSKISWLLSFPNTVSSTNIL